jgi:Lamin Tail Domain
VPNPSATSAGSSTPSALSAIVIAILVATVGPLVAVAASAVAAADHLVISEVVTGGSSASDELIEIYNPTSDALPLEGLELVYVSASGATIGRRAAWELGAPSVPAGGHVLVANEAGVYAPIADASYASGMAATGGSVALRIQGASTAIDAVGWGSATNTWLEGTPVAAAAAGSSIERLPGGALGSTQDTDDNAADFSERLVPDPQNASSAPVPDPTATPTPTLTPPPTSTAEPTTAATVVPTPAPTSTPAPSGDPIVSIATARGLPDGTSVTIEGIAITGSDFHDGGGYVVDATGGVAVMVDGGAYALGALLRVTGAIEDRFSQRTIRTSAAEVVVVGDGTPPAPLERATGTIGEGVEGILVRIAGTIDGGATVLSSGLAFDVDDGSGAVRVVVGTLAGIGTESWTDGVTVDLVGVVGQRDSSGTGAAGYRVQPRTPADVLGVVPPTPAPSATEGPSPTSEPTATPIPDGVVSIVDAREADKNARVTVRGVVTLASGVVDDPTAVIQDQTGAIVLRLGDEAGSVSRGELIEVSGVRSTKSGMETIRVSDAPRRLGAAPLPAARVVATGAVGEEHEARLVLVRGGVVATPRRSSAGTLTFDLDDGSGPLRIAVDGSLGVDPASFPAGTWLEIQGVVGQQTTGAQPLRGYRLWPGIASEVRIVAAATESGGSGAAHGASEGSGPAASLASVGGADLGSLTVGATLVAGPWEELGIGGLLWDGRRLVAIAPGAVTALPSAAVPIRLELRGLRAVGELEPIGLPIVALGRGPGDVVAATGAAHSPLSAVPARGRSPSWVSLVGTLGGGQHASLLVPGGRRIGVDVRCTAASDLPRGVVGVVGVGLADPARVVVGCSGVRAAPSLIDGVAAAKQRSPDAQASKASTGIAALDAAARGAAPRRTLSAMLLAVGALALVVGALLRRLLPPEPVAEAPDAPLSDDPTAPEDIGPPRLTLVPLPHERGSS